MDKQLIIDVQNLVNEVEKTHRYSMSRIYGLWNRVHERNEKPQSCASCLIRKVKELREWLSTQPTDSLDTTTKNAEKIVNNASKTQDTPKPRGRKKKQ